MSLLDRTRKHAAQEPIHYRVVRTGVEDSASASPAAIRAVADAVIADGMHKRIGSARIQNFGDKRLLDAVHVDDQFQNRGIAKTLLARLLEAADTEFPEEDIYLRATPYANKPISAKKLQQLYARYGFTPLRVPGIRLPQFDDPEDEFKAYAIGTGPGAMIRRAAK